MVATASATGPGAAYVFRLHDGTWSEEQKLTAADGSDGDQFGSSVAIEGDVVVVGARLHAAIRASVESSINGRT